MVGFVLHQDFTLTPLAGFVDALRLAADHGDESRQVHCGWELLSADLELIRASCGLQVVPTELFGDPVKFDHIVVVGGKLSSMHHYPEDMLDYLRRAHAAGVPLVGLCTGTMVLAAAGLLQDRRCCVHFDTQRYMLELFPDTIPITDANFVVDGNIITCPGSIVAIEVAAYLIRRHCGRSRATKATNYLLMASKHPGIYVRDQPYEDRLVNAHRITRDAVGIMEMDVSDPCNIETLAKRVNATPSKLKRCFNRDLEMAPATFWRKLRLDHARSLVVDTVKSLTEIAYETGFSDSSHFCRAFRQTYGASPQVYRRKTRT